MSHSLLLVCDMINDLVHQDGPNGKSGYGVEIARRHTIAHAAEAIAGARAAGVPIAYVRVGFSADYRECPPNSQVFQGAKKAGLFKLGSWGTEVHPELAPQAGDFDVIKHRVSPFYATSLPAILGALQVRHLYVFGVSTSGAVLSAVKDAHDRDLRVTVIEDACCAISDAQHKAVLEQMNRIAAIATSASVEYDVQ